MIIILTSATFFPVFFMGTDVNIGTKTCSGLNGPK